MPNEKDRFNPMENNLNKPQDFDQDVTKEQKDQAAEENRPGATSYDADPFTKYRNLDPDKQNSEEDMNTNPQSTPDEMDSYPQEEEVNTQFPPNSDETVNTDLDTDLSPESDEFDKEDENK